MKNLKELLQKEIDNGVSKRALAQKLKMHQNMIDAYLTETSEPREETLVKIAKAFGVSVAWLRGGEASELSPLLQKFLPKISAEKQMLIDYLTDDEAVECIALIRQRRKDQG